MFYAFVLERGKKLGFPTMPKICEYAKHHYGILGYMREYPLLSLCDRYLTNLEKQKLQGVFLQTYCTILGFNDHAHTSAAQDVEYTPTASPPNCRDDGYSSAGSDVSDGFSNEVRYSICFECSSHGKGKTATDGKFLCNGCFQKHVKDIDNSQINKQFLANNFLSNDLRKNFSEQGNTNNGSASVASPIERGHADKPMQHTVGNNIISSVREISGQSLMNGQCNYRDCDNGSLLCTPYYSQMSEQGNTNNGCENITDSQPVTLKCVFETDDDCGTSCDTEGLHGDDVFSPSPRSSERCTPLWSSSEYFFKYAALPSFSAFV